MPLTELGALRKLEAAVKSKQVSLEGFVQEYGEIVVALKEVEAARLKDKKVHEAQNATMDDLKKEKEAIKKQMYEMAAQKAYANKNGMPISLGGGSGNSNGGNLILSGGNSSGVAGNGSSFPNDATFYDAIRKYAKTMKF